jgi:hypothetical protein
VDARHKAGHDELCHEALLPLASLRVGIWFDVMPCESGASAAAWCFIIDAADYRIIRWSLSSGGALRRPRGG